MISTRALRLIALTISTICFWAMDKIGDPGLRRDIQPHFRQHDADPTRHFGAIEQAVARQFAPEKDVFRHRHLLGEIEFLVDENDPQGLGLAVAGQLDFLAVKPDRTGGGVVEPRKDLHQGGLAGAVFADQRMNFAGADVESLR
jgi:hypothetical protein